MISQDLLVLQSFYFQFLLFLKQFFNLGLLKIWFSDFVV